ncbi:MAG: hypothetical protein R1F54_06810 [Candidatus Zeuxoniibacter abyssi]|nr:MAG: hypothetical protein R1F54_06810 [Candidatus Persebacteraceae bacterium AB1(2)]
MSSSAQSRYAVVDIGSNATRLLVATFDGDKMMEEMFTRVPLRPMEGVAGKISPAAEKNLLKVLSGLRLLIESLKPKSWQAVATAALRDCKNRDALLDKIHRLAGVSVRVLSGREEAETVGRFVAAQFSPKRTLLNVDCGGGSTDCAIVANGKVAAAETFTVGTARPDCGGAAEKTRLTKWLRQNTARRKNIIVAGSGGSVRKLGEICGGIGDISLAKQQKRLLALSVSERAIKFNLTLDRAFSIIPAIEIYRLVLAATNAKSLEVVTGGLAAAVMNEMRKK